MKPVATKLETQQFQCFRVSTEDFKRLEALPTGAKLFTAEQIKAAKVAVLREAVARLPSYNENHAILCRMADELESSLNAGETT